MTDAVLTTDAKARLFDQLVRHEQLLVDGLTLLARDKARALITLHKSGLRPGGRAYGQADFGLPEISAVHEILTGEPLNVDALVEEQRLQLEHEIATPHGDPAATE
ncbi:hypothetical protein [Methylibium petroleiphilum]|uniref:Uncharacterized protein n=1 Tax=Methylibium petroleiphilum (strain ATCC BAA-1232 / LMG 22953 / PM1) TaxID=420662 RepID=A2SN87_METPP|nr:hypothetical protein [Methylibium petroleiphilum]ABM97026.1 hypothetical protein Mpe_B0251 [Methylibium petroleiphilum PM1]